MEETKRRAINELLILFYFLIENNKNKLARCSFKQEIMPNNKKLAFALRGGEI